MDGIDQLLNEVRKDTMRNTAVDATSETSQTLEQAQAQIIELKKQLARLPRNKRGEPLTQRINTRATDTLYDKVATFAHKHNIETISEAVRAMLTLFTG